MCDGEKKYVVSPGPWGLNSKKKKKAEEGGVKIIPYIKNEIPSARVKKKKNKERMVLEGPTVAISGIYAREVV